VECFTKGRKVIDEEQDTITNESLQLEGLASEANRARHTTTQEVEVEESHRNRQGTRGDG